ncbi:MAG: ABC transporter ATP-binding protein [Armatimonadetes bacterium]|nr:ABC transporter ATP-binding protein [Armatimonadota bacterium]
MRRHGAVEPVGGSTLSAEAVIQTSGLSKRFGRIRAVDGLNLTVPRGAVFGFLGPNGAGKSTTIRMLTGLLRPTAGEALILGRPLCERLRIGRRVGALIEEPDLYSHLTAWQNLRLLSSLSGGAKRDELREALELVGLGDYAHRRVSTFSHGMKQRLGIAQALVPRPELLILDEPASGLDPEGLAEVRDLLRTLAEEGVTIFLSSHLLSEVEQLCTEVAVLHRGRVVAQGPVGGLLESSGHKTRVRADNPRRAVAVLSRLPSTQAKLADDGLVEVEAISMNAADINETLVKAGLRVYELAPARKSLETLYIEIVRRAEHEPDNADTEPPAAAGSH